MEKNNLEGVYGKLRKLVSPGAPKDSNYAIASYILKHPTEILDFTSAQLAKASGVSAPSVSRFVTKYGFSTFANLKDEMKKEREHNKLFNASHETGAPFTIPFSQKQINQEILQLSDQMRDFFKPEALYVLEDLAKTIQKSKQIYLYGNPAMDMILEHLAYEFYINDKYVELLPKLCESSKKDKDSVLILFTIDEQSFSKATEEDWDRLMNYYDKIYLFTQTDIDAPVPTGHFNKCKSPTADWMAWILVADQLVYMTKAY